jgi:uncharacterized protein (TIGR00369 family)
VDTVIPPGFKPADFGGEYGAFLGPFFVDRSSGRLGFRVASRHTNGSGTLHGGAMSTFADTQLMAVRPGIEEGGLQCPTIHLTVDLVAAARIGEWVEAQVTVVRSTRTLIFTQALISVDGRAVARSSAIYRNQS